VRDFADWLHLTAPSVAIQSTFWFIRLLQAAHLITAGVVAGSGVALALRVLGRQRADVPFDAVWRRFAPWLVGGLAVMLVTGALQTLGDPVREFTATSYWVKLALLGAAAAGTLWLVQGARRSSAPAEEFSFAAKLVAVAVILFWLALPWLGRMIAYDRALWGSLSLRT
jgi:hypothetical protein